EDGGAQGAVASADQRAVGFVYFVTLITRRSQSGASGDGFGVGVVFDGSGFGAKVGGADDVDSGEGEQQDVRRLHEPAGDLAFQPLDFQGFLPSIAVVGQGDRSEERRVG